MLPVDFIALMLVLETVDFFIVKKQLEMHIIVLEGQYIADNFEMASCLPSPDAAKNPSAQHPNWWTDNPASEFAEGDHIGAKTVSQWREDFLRDFAERMQRCQAPRKADTISHSTSI